MGCTMPLNILINFIANSDKIVYQTYASYYIYKRHAPMTNLFMFSKMYCI